MHLKDVRGCAVTSGHMFLRAGEAKGSLVSVDACAWREQVTNEIAIDKGLSLRKWL